MPYFMLAMQRTGVGVDPWLTRVSLMLTLAARSAALLAARCDDALDGTSQAPNV